MHPKYQKIDKEALQKKISDNKNRNTGFSEQSWGNKLDAYFKPRNESVLDSMTRLEMAIFGDSTRILG